MKINIKGIILVILLICLQYQVIKLYIDINIYKFIYIQIVFICFKYLIIFLKPYFIITNDKAVDK